MNCELSAYSDKDVVKAATTSFGRHLWYLLELLVDFSFFDDRVPVEEKRLNVLALRENDGSEDPPKRISPFPDPMTKEIHEFITKSALKFFKLLDLQEEFLEHEPSEWGRLEVYQSNQQVVRSAKVVNDLAERGIALMQEFNSSLTRIKSKNSSYCRLLRTTGRLSQHQQKLQQLRKQYHSDTDKDTEFWRRPISMKSGE